MVKFLSELIGSQIILFQEMARVGTISDVVIDAQSGNFVALEVKLQKERKYIPISEIKGYGKTAVMIKDFASLSNPEDVVRIKEALPAPQILGARVVDEEGSTVGKVSDATINLAHTTLEKLYVTPPLSLKMLTDSLIIPAKNIVKIEKKKIIVRANGREKIKKSIALPTPVAE